MYLGPLLVLIALVLMSVSSLRPTGSEEYASVITLNAEAECLQFTSMHDSVMGGVSSGLIVFRDGCGVFEGVVRTENNGGFASVRRGVQLDGRGFHGLYLDVSSDDPARAYSLGVKDGMCLSMGGVNFKAKFVASSTVARILVPFSEMIPEFRGRTLTSVPPLDVGNIKELSFYANRPAGSFKLSLSEVGFFRKSVGKF